MLSWFEGGRLWSWRSLALSWPKLRWTNDFGCIWPLRDATASPFQILPGGNRSRKVWKGSVLPEAARESDSKCTPLELSRSETSSAVWPTRRRSLAHTDSQNTESCSGKGKGCSYGHAPGSRNTWRAAAHALMLLRACWCSRLRGSNKSNKLARKGRGNSREKAGRFL